MMRFNSIEILNYRQYKKLKFDFPKNNEYDLHVIVGQNGMGKTNILNAVTWCLYGVEPHLGDGSRSLPKMNLESKKEAIDNDLDTVNVEVKIFTEDSGQLISFQRKLPIGVDKDFEYKEEFLVTATDIANNTKTYENDEAIEFVNRYMPEKIREYFYFDGEQLHNYFLSDQNAKIKDSVHTISQVDMLTRIKERMGKLIIKKQKEAGKLAPDVDKINKEISIVKSKVERFETNINELKKQILKSENIIIENTEHLRGQDNLPELEERYQVLKLKLENLEKDRGTLIKELKAFIRDNKIALSFYSSAKETIRIIQEKESDNSLPPNIDKGLLKKVLKEHKCFLCGRELNLDSEKKVKKILDQIMVSSQTSHLLLSIKSELERIVIEAELYLKNKDIILKRVRKNEHEIQEIEIELQKIDNEINRFTDKKQIKLWHTERNEHTKLFKFNNQRIGSEKKQAEDAYVELSSLERKLEESMAKLNECKKVNEMILFSKKSKNVIESVEVEMMDEVKINMEELTSNYFDKLVWKKNTYKNIKLDENYHLDLIHVDGYSCVGSCSAAERSLLALSFTLALHEVSGFNSLLFIDTPVARVSDLNRINFADVLKEVSKNKQIIMTFSPDEYSHEVKKIFEPSVSTKIQLVTEQEKFTVFN